MGVQPPRHGQVHARLALLRRCAPLALDLRLERWGDEGSRPKSSRRSKSPAPEVDETARPLFEALRAWRAAAAAEAGKPPYVIAHDRLLAELSMLRPRSSIELAGLSGIGPSKLERYGPDMLRIVEEHRTE